MRRTARNFILGLILGIHVIAVDSRPTHAEQNITLRVPVNITKLMYEVVAIRISCWVDRSPNCTLGCFAYAEKTVPVVDGSVVGTYTLHLINTVPIQAEHYTCYFMLRNNCGEYGCANSFPMNSDEVPAWQRVDVNEPFDHWITGPLVQEAPVDQDAPSGFAPATSPSGD